MNPSDFAERPKRFDGIENKIANSENRANPFKTFFISRSSPVSDIAVKKRCHSENEVTNC